MESTSPARGFTLIEIIVSITILLVLGGLFVANYNEFNNSQIVNQSTSDMVMNLQAARTKATSGVKPSGCDTLVGYIVNFPTTGSYTTSALCLVGGSQSTVGDVHVYTLPTGVTFPSPTPGPITFYALGRGASVDQTISIVGNGVTGMVSVFRSGLISDFISTPTGVQNQPTPTSPPPPPPTATRTGTPPPAPTRTPTPTNTPTPTPTATPTGNPGTSFNFISWSDTETNLTTLASLSNQAAGMQPEFTIYNGDGELGFPTDWNAAVSGNTNNGLFEKTFAVRGNGNTSTPGWANNFDFAGVASRIGATNYTELVHHYTYSFDYGNSRFIGVDVPGCVSGPISSAQNTWINERLTDAESRGLTHAFLFFHQPIYYVNLHSCAVPANLMTTFNNHPIVTATFHGHEHVKAEVQFGPGAPVPNRIAGVTHPWYEFVTAPAGGGNYSCTAGRSDYCATYEGFANITVSGGTVRVDFYDTANTLKKTVSFTK